jgi:hypothetical protein
MNLTTTLLFYLLIGGGVAAAVYLFGESRGAERWFRTMTAVVFWPLYLPILLQRPTSPGDKRSGIIPDLRETKLGAADEISTAIHQVEAELDLALNSLDGWSDSVLAREQHRFAELRAAWHAQAQKIRELNQLLDQSAFVESPLVQSTTAFGERVAASERGRRENIARMRAVQLRLHGDLMNTLARVRELVTMIHLAKYTGAPASRTEELVVQIATAVEGLSEVAGWREEDEIGESSLELIPCSQAPPGNTRTGGSASAKL